MVERKKSVLSCLEPDAMERLRRQSVSRVFGRNELVVTERDMGDSFYVIEYGKVRVTLFSLEGKEISFTELHQGDNFGEYSAIDGKPRSANVIALEESRIISIPPDVFQRMLMENPRVAIELMRQMTEVVRRLSDRIFESSTLDLGRRLIVELARQGRSLVDESGRCVFSRPPTHNELASRLSCSREAVSREIANLERSGLVKRGRRKLEIPDFQRLQDQIDAMTL